ncbi:hypothetical protein [Clostridium tyrobutyricum]|uniref:hypothetical protein n=1 Tax=Clostridium tyrobutyricum TaxID=1519 RepID=UPI0011C83FBA|nr:hypothetical protein [Clostridium tyrobutyricum]
MLKKISVSVELDITFDTETNTFAIEKNTARINDSNQPTVITMQRVLQVAEIRYGILTLGSKSPIGRILEQDEDIVVIFNGMRYQCHTHKISQGRIDRITAIMKNFNVGSLLELSYNTENKELSIK